MTIQYLYFIRQTGTVSVYQSLFPNINHLSTTVVKEMSDGERRIHLDLIDFCENSIKDGNLQFASSHNQNLIKLFLELGFERVNDYFDKYFNSGTLKEYKYMMFHYTIERYWYDPVHLSNALELIPKSLTSGGERLEIGEYSLSHEKLFVNMIRSDQFQTLEQAREFLKHSQEYVGKDYRYNPMGDSCPPKPPR